jgi:hypothetical protein
MKWSPTTLLLILLVFVPIVAAQYVPDGGSNVPLEFSPVYTPDGGSNVPLQFTSGAGSAQMTLVFNASLYRTFDSIEVNVSANFSMPYNLTINLSLDGAAIGWASYENITGYNETFKANVSHTNYTKNQTVNAEARILRNSQEKGSVTGSAFINNTNPVINETPATETIFIGTLYNVSINCTDDDADAIIYADNRSEFEINKDTGLIEWDTSAEAAQDYEIELSCHDGEVNTSVEYTLTLINFINNTMELNGVSADRKYEFGSNITVNVTMHGTPSSTCVSIGEIINHTCDNQSFGFEFPVVQFNLTGWDDGTNVSKIFTLNETHRRERNPRVDALGGIIDLDALDSVRDLQLLINGELSNIIKGNITRKLLFYDRFNDAVNETLTYASPSTQTVVLNISQRRLINGTADMHGIATNPEEFNATEEFINFSRLDTVLSTPGATHTLWDSLDQEVSSRWNFNEEDDGVTRAQVDGANSKLEIFLDDSIPTPGGGPANSKDWSGRGNSQTFNASRFERFEVHAVQQMVISCADDGTLCSGGSGTSSLYITDDVQGTNRQGYGVASSSCFCGAQSGTQSYTGRYIFERIKGGKWNVTPDGQATVTLGPFSDILEVGAEITADGFTTANNGLSVQAFSEIHDINLSAYGTVNDSTTTWAGAFNYTSTLLFESSENLTSAKLDAFELDEDDQGTFLYYMSIDNGSTWDSVVNGNLHFFAHAGNRLKVRVEGNQTLFDKPIAVYEFQVDVSTGFPRDLQFDVGNNGTIDLYMPGEINTTNSPVQWNFTASFGDIIDQYVEDNCINIHPHVCEVPIGITSNNSGILQIRDLILNSTLNPVTLNSSMVEEACDTDDCEWNITLQQGDHEGSEINATRFAIDIVGDLNVSIGMESTIVGPSSGVTEQNYTLLIRYSKFNWSSEIPVFYFVPQTPNDKNLEPFGQSTRHNKSSFNISSLAQIDDFFLEVGLNESVGDTCVQEYMGRQPDQTGMIEINLTHGNVFNRLDGNYTLTMKDDPIYAWANMTSCNGSTFRYADPLNLIESICVECVKWNNITGGR